MQVLRSDEIATDAGVAEVGRVTAYQVYQGEGYNSLFVTEAVGARTFERFQGWNRHYPGAGGLAGHFGWT